MNCDCMNKYQDKIKEQYKEKLETDEVQVSIENWAIEMSGRMTLSVPFRVKADKPGFKAHKGRQVQFLVNYCPFCGESAQ